MTFPHPLPFGGISVVSTSVVGISRPMGGALWTDKIDTEGDSLTAVGESRAGYTGGVYPYIDLTVQGLFPGG